MTRRYTVIGAGGWGTAMACHLAQKGIHVMMWGHNGEYAESMQKSRTNPKFLPHCRFPDNLVVTGDPACLEDADCVLSVVPTRHLRSVWQELAPLCPPRTPIVSLTKGIEIDTLDRPTDILKELLPRRPIAVLSGPSHAEEVVKGKPTVVTVASSSGALAKRLQQEFSTEVFRVYTNTDLLGVELGGAVKNVIAIAAGIVDGLGLGDNTKSALLTRGLAEIVALGTKMGARRNTFYGIAGIGDLMTTAFSPFGRNRAVGEKLGRGTPLSEILSGTQMVAEGVTSAKSVTALAKKLSIEMPISLEVYRVLFEDKDPRKALLELMTRRHRSE